MKKLLFIAATAAVALSSCSSDEEIANVGGSENLDGAVVFNAYTARATRAYDEKNITGLDALKEATSPGFGVFAYEQGKAGFSTFAASTSYPNFMYNQQVKWNSSASTAAPGLTYPTTSGAWEYAPVKYYSNNEGAKHSFFAYAPWQKDANLSPVFRLGYAPALRYNSLQDIDLLWAAPTEDKLKAGITENIEFNFRHALSKVNFHVAPFIDLVHPEHGIPATAQKLTKGTKVTVKSIRFIGTVPTQGLLDLETGKWTIENADEGGTIINCAKVEWDATSAATPINSYLGANLASNTNGYIAPVKVIPAEQVKIEIVYDVETVDDTKDVNDKFNHTDGKNNHKETNVVVSKETFDLKSGIEYHFYLDLGLTSVKFDAKMFDWGYSENQYVDLPNNHDFHLVSTAYLSAAPTSATIAKNKPATDSGTKDNYTYYDGILYKCTTSYAAASDPKPAVDAVWEVAADGAYKTSTAGEIYVVENGICTQYDVYTTNGTAFNDGAADISPTADLISITPASDGYVQKTDGTWTNPKKDAYYTVGSFLYKWVATDVPENPNR